MARKRPKPPKVSFLPPEARQNPAAWMNAETIKFIKLKLKWWSFRSLLALAVFIVGTILLPIEGIWKGVRLLLMIPAALAFTPILYYGAMLIGEWLDRAKDSR